MGKVKLVLGKGLSALIPTDYPSSDAAPEPRISSPKPAEPPVQKPIEQSELGTGEIPIESIRRNPYQPREEFEPQALEELTESIREHGVIQPITVCRVQGGFELIAGERRLRASRAAGLKTIPALIKEVGSDAELLELALIENVQREHLNPMEIAHGYQRLIDDCNLTQEDVAQKVSKDRTTVTNFLRLLKLPGEIQDSLRKNQLTSGHARALVTLPTRELQIEVWEKIIKDGLSVRRAEELARKEMQKSGENKPSPSGKLQEVRPPAKELYGGYGDIKSRLRAVLATQVKVRTALDGKGHIEIEFYSDDDLTRIVEIIEATRESQ